MESRIRGGAGRRDLARRAGRYADRALGSRGLWAPSRYASAVEQVPDRPGGRLGRRTLVTVAIRCRGTRRDLLLVGLLFCFFRSRAHRSAFQREPARGTAASRSAFPKPFQRLYGPRRCAPALDVSRRLLSLYPSSAIRIERNLPERNSVLRNSCPKKVLPPPKGKAERARYFPPGPVSACPSAAGRSASSDSRTRSSSPSVCATVVLSSSIESACVESR